ncbi:hypothetical protein BCR35DRAFT_198760 [Leucosporidium creatinivorum]|uniref:Uncharacterized protein n=1 Tax=Leucosporidium creatinivorum TaxID=106004 RepID=A0A1Y2DKS9_9BASI|nr:hypothetical protein BCR35DRAFT_198760 [Leucosporidium creatinivorum]
MITRDLLLHYSSGRAGRVPSEASQRVAIRTRADSFFCTPIASPRALPCTPVDAAKPLLDSSTTSIPSARTAPFVLVLESLRFCRRSVSACTSVLGPLLRRFRRSTATAATRSCLPVAPLRSATSALRLPATTSPRRASKSDRLRSGDPSLLACSSPEPATYPRSLNTPPSSPSGARSFHQLASPAQALPSSSTTQPSPA